MLFLSKDNNNGFIVVDTEDWSKERVDNVLLHRLEGFGIKIHNRDCQKAILQLLQSYYVLQTEVGGGSTLDLCDEYIADVIGMESLQYDLGSSCIDLLKDVKSKFKELKKQWGTLTTSIFSYDGIYLAFSDTIKSVNNGKETRNNSIYNFCSVYGFDKEITSDTLWLI